MFLMMFLEFERRRLGFFDLFDAIKSLFDQVY